MAYFTDFLVNQDKEHRLPAEKKTKAWMDIKLFHQTKISDMYKDSDNVYRFIKSELNLIDCLIIDIDGGLSFNDFEKKYQHWTWFAYPTINNLSHNWTKFRVIVPLSATIKINGDHNLKLLKMLRTMFCPYEDPNPENIFNLSGTWGMVEVFVVQLCAEAMVR